MVTPAISEVRVHMETWCNRRIRLTVTKAIGTTLDTWVTVLSSGDAELGNEASLGQRISGLRTPLGNSSLFATWQIRHRAERYSAGHASRLPIVTVTLPRPSEYQGCGPRQEKKVEACIQLGHDAPHQAEVCLRTVPVGSVGTTRWLIPEIGLSGTLGEAPAPTGTLLDPNRESQAKRGIPLGKRSKSGRVIAVTWTSRWVLEIPATDTRWVDAPEPLRWQLVDGHR